MKKTIRVTLVQTELHWEDIPANLAMFDRKLATLEATQRSTGNSTPGSTGENAPGGTRESLPGDPGEATSPVTGTNLVILPEMFSTGFSMRPESLAEAPKGPTTQWMAEKARQLNAVITGSMIICHGGRYFNRLIWMRPDGTFETYDKKHLFGLGDETSHYTAGDRKLVTDLNGWKICPMICYDLRFPAWCRNTENYDLYINVANWPKKRAEHWNTLVRARAIENLCYVAAVNRIGDDGNGFAHAGDSQVVDPAGNILCHNAGQEDIVTVTLERAVITKARRVFPFLRDMDKFEIK